MRFLHPERDEQLEISLDDVFLLPGFFDGSSRSEVELTPNDFVGGSHPLVSANMNNVTGKRMGETMARLGGLGVLPQDMSLPTVERIVGHIKKADIRYDTALTVMAGATLRDVQGIIRKRSHGMVLVVDDDNRLIGVITSSNLRGKDQYTRAAKLMSRELVTLSPQTSNREAFLLMERSHVKAAPVVDQARHVLGILTRDDAVRTELITPSLDSAGRLMVAAAVGISARAPKRAARLLELEVDALVLDTAHGHQRQMIEALRAVRKVCGTNVPLVAGNVCTAEGTRALIEAGADIVKVNVGPGAMCTTRMQTGAGRPTFTSVLHCSREARALGRHVWADGGVRAPRDVALYLAAGASRVMVGTLLAGTYESPGDIQEDHAGALYKENYGMASARAVQERTAELGPFEAAVKQMFQEGISTSRIYLREGFESAGAHIVDVLTGLQSACTYVGVRNVTELYEHAVVGVQSSAGFSEGRPHGRIRK